MTTRKKATEGKGRVKKLALKKETLKDLEAKKKAPQIKGGRPIPISAEVLTRLACC